MRKKYNDAKYRNYIRTTKCIVGGCEQRPVRVHHILGGSSKRNNDYFSVGLCDEHHTGNYGVHTKGRQTFEETYGIEFYSEAAKLLIGYIRGSYGKEQAIKAMINSMEDE